jgi:ABC-2 type transport system permease protein
MPIRDMGYRPYKGELLSHRGRYWTIARRVLAGAWSARAVKLGLLAALFPMVGCGVAMYIKMKLDMVTGSNFKLDLEEADHLVFLLYYWCQIWFAFGLSQRVGAPAIADDMRTGAFSFYFCRPVSRAHYVAGKILPVAFLVGLASTLPALLLSLFRLSLASDGADAWIALKLVGATLALTPFYLGLFAVLPVCLGALTSRSKAVQYLWSGVFFLSWIAGEGIATAAEEPMLVLISLPSALKLVAQHLYGYPLDHPLPFYYPAGVLTGVIALSIWGLWRRLEQVEMFTS